MAARWHRVLRISILLCASVQLPSVVRSFPVNSDAGNGISFQRLHLPGSDSAASHFSDHPQLQPAPPRMKRANQAYMRYISQRKMRQADERELRQKLANRIIPPAATTPGSFLSRLPLPRMPEINTTAIMARVPPKVIMTLNETAMNVMQSIPPQVMGAIGAAREAIPQYIEQLRGPVNQAMGSAVAMGQQMIGTLQQGYRAAKSGDLMATMAGMMGMGGGPSPPPAGRQPAPPEPASQLANLRRMAGAVMARVMGPPEPGSEPNRITIIGQRVMEAINSNPNLRNVMAKVMSMMPMPEPAPKAKS